MTRFTVPGSVECLQHGTSVASMSRILLVGLQPRVLWEQGGRQENHFWPITPENRDVIGKNKSAVCHLFLDRDMAADLLAMGMCAKCNVLSRDIKDWWAFECCTWGKTGRRLTVWDRRLAVFRPLEVDVEAWQHAFDVAGGAIASPSQICAAD